MGTFITLGHIKTIIPVLLLRHSPDEKRRVALHEKEGEALAEQPGGHIFHFTNLPSLCHCQLGHLLICYSAPWASAARGMKLNL